MCADFKFLGGGEEALLGSKSEKDKVISSRETFAISYAGQQRLVQSYIQSERFLSRRCVFSIKKLSGDEATCGTAILFIASLVD